MCVGVRLVPFGDWREKIALRPGALDIVIRHHNVNHILGAAFGHMAADAVAGYRMSARIGQLRQGRGVALPAHLDIVPSRGPTLCALPVVKKVN